jgi:cyclic beta-1,2-glucan synthetase
MVSGIGETREAALRLVEKYQDRRLADRVFDLAWTHGQVLLRQLNAVRGRRAALWPPCRLDHLRQCLAASRPGHPHQEPPGAIRSLGLCHFRRFADRAAADEDPANIELVRQLVQAHAYWRLKGLAVDLVIWNEDHAGYRQLLHDQIMGLIAAGIEAGVTDQPGGIFVSSGGPDRGRGPHPDPDGRARHHLRQPGTLAEQINGRTLRKSPFPCLTRPEPHRSEPLRWLRCPATI